MFMNSIKKYQLNGKVKSVKYFTEKNSNELLQENIDKLSRIEADEFLHESFEFQLSEILFNEFGNVIYLKNKIEEFYFYYDDFKKITICKVFSYPSKDKPSKIINYTYNSLNQIIQEVVLDYQKCDDFTGEWFISDDCYCSVVRNYSYDEKNRIVELKEFSDEQKTQCIMSLKNTFDSHDNIIEQKKRSIYDFGNYHKYFVYDSNNRLCKKQWEYHSASGITETYRNLSDYNENVIYMTEKTKWNHFGASITHHFKYNEHDSVIEIIVNRLDNQGGNSIITNDILSFEYLYDTNYNWYLKRHLINGQEIQTDKRQIEYYN